MKEAGESLKAKQFKKALTILEEAEGYISKETITDSKTLIPFYNQLGEVYFYNDMIVKANETFSKGLAVQDFYDAPAKEAELLNSLALTEKILGSFESAENHYKRAKKIYEKIGLRENLHYIHTLSNLANLLKGMGKYVQAQESYNEAFYLSSNVQGIPAFVKFRILNNMATLYYAQARYKKAESLLFESMRYRVKKFGIDSFQYAESLNNLANVYQHQDLEKAELIFKNSLRICEKTLEPDDIRTAKTQKNLAAVLGENKKTDTAKSLLLKALKTLKEKVGTDSPLYWRTVKAYADIIWKTGALDDAINHYREVLTFLNKNSDVFQRDFIRATIDFSKVLYDTGQREASLDYLRKGIMKQNTFFWHIIKGLPEDTSLELLRYMEEDTGYLISVLLEFQEDQEVVNDLYPLLYVRKGMIFEVAYLQRMKAALSDDQALMEKFNTYKKKRSELARRLFTGAAEKEKKDEFKTRQLYLLEECIELERELISKLPEHYPDEKPGFSSTMVERLGKNAMILDYYKYREYRFDQKAFTGSESYCVFYTRLESGTIQTVPKPVGSSEDIEKLVTKYRRNIGGEKDSRGTGHSRLSSINEMITICKQLYQMLLPDFSSITPVSGTKKDILHCFISPDAELSGLSFESFISPTDEFFIDHFTVSYCNSLRDLERIQTPGRRSSSFVLLTDPQFDLNVQQPGKDSPIQLKKRETSLLNLLREKVSEDGYYSRLAGTAEEGRRIRELLEDSGMTLTAYYTKEEAKEKVVKEIHSPSVLHIATHGFFISDNRYEIPHPLFRSGIVLSGVNSVLKGHSIPDDYEDGVLSAYDAATLNLRDTNMVVLSACETGLGESKRSEGILGLRRSFAQAGAKTVIMSLWRVSDKHTKILMECFYENLFDGKAIPTALREAQLKLIDYLDETFGFASPSLWSGFVCHGETRAFV